MNAVSFGYEFIVTVSIATVVFLVQWCDADSCSKLSSCSCQCSGGKIDLKKLASSNGPRFQDYPSQDGYSYSYNPCLDFIETNPASFEDHCQGVAACQVINQGGAWQFYDTGVQSTVSFQSTSARDYDIDADEDVIVAKYVSGDQGRQTEVVLRCKDDEKFDAVGELAGSSPPTYRFILEAPEACFEGGLSGGSILIIVCLSILVLYLVVGVLFNKFGRHQSGKHLLPNYEFWTTLPRAVKDGCLFVLKRGAYNPVRYDDN